MRSFVLFVVAIALGLLLAARLEGDEFDSLSDGDPFSCLCAAPAPNLVVAAVPTYEVTFRNVWYHYTNETLADHLAGPNHNLDPADLVGLSPDELVALHSSDHDRQLDRGQVGRARLIFQPLPKTQPALRDLDLTFGSNCPGGNCPTARQPVRRLFGRFRK